MSRTALIQAKQYPGQRWFKLKVSKQLTMTSERHLGEVRFASKWDHTFFFFFFFLTMAVWIKIALRAKCESCSTKLDFHQSKKNVPDFFFSFSLFSYIAFVPQVTCVRIMIKGYLVIIQHQFLLYKRPKVC